MQILEVFDYFISYYGTNIEFFNFIGIYNLKLSTLSSRTDGWIKACVFIITQTGYVSDHSNFA